MQGYLSRLLGREIYGYYYATLGPIDYWKKQGVKSSAYLGEGLPNYYDSVAIQNRHFIEYIICHTDPSFVYMGVDNNGSLTPMFRQEDGLLNRKKFISELHSGTVDFIKNFKSNYLSVIDNLYFYPELTEAPLTYFMMKPGKLDVTLFKNCFFEDSVGGIESRSIVSTSSKNTIDSVWKPDIPSKKSRQELQSNDKKNDVSNHDDKSCDTSVFYQLEKWCIKRFVTEQKYNKYLRDRDSFFKDSRSNLIKFYYRLRRK